MRYVREYIVITIGILILAAGLYYFLIPGQLAAGGAMGIAMIIANYFPMFQVGQMMMIINVFLFLVAFVVLGTRFGVKTIYTTLGLSGMIWALERFHPLDKPPTEDLLLCAILGTIISGAGMGIIFNQGASSGGTDIIAKIINKYTHLDIGKALLLTDGAITLAAARVFGFDKGMYALLAVIFNGSVIDYTIQGLNVATQVFVVTSKPDSIARFIMDRLERGVTLFDAQGGYTGRRLKVVYTVLNRREFVALKEFIRQEDPKAFVTVSQAHDVLGEGFKSITSE